MRFTVIVISLFALVGCAKPQILEKHFSPEQILPLSQYRNLKNAAAINRHVAYLKKGDRIPLKLEIHSDLVGLAQDQIDLVAKRKLFFRIALPETISKNDLDKILSLNQGRLSTMTANERETLFKGVMLYISPDGSMWAPLNDMRALKKIFGIEAGTLSFGVAMSESEGVWASFVLTLIRTDNP